MRVAKGTLDRESVTDSTHTHTRAHAYTHTRAHACTHTNTHRVTFINCSKRQKAEQWWPEDGDGDGKREVSANRYEDVAEVGGWGAGWKCSKLTVDMAAQLSTHPRKH